MRNAIPPGLALVAGLAWLAGCGKPEQPPAPPLVKVTVLREGVVRAPARLPATIRAQRVVNLSFEIDGRVESMHPAGSHDLAIGDVLKGGAVVARLDGREARSRRDAAAAMLASAEAQLKAAATTRPATQATQPTKAPADPAALDAALRAVESVRKDLETAEARLAACGLKCPLDDACVLAVSAQAGDRVAAHVPVVGVSDLSKVVAAVDVPQALALAELSAIRVGHKLPLVIDGLESARWEGEIVALSPGPRDGVFTARVLVDNPATPAGVLPRRLWPGMSGAVMVGHERRGLLVPVSAVVREGGGLFVWKIEQRGEQSTARKAAFVAGGVVGSSVVVGQGLVDGDRIVLRPEGLSDGQAVRAVVEGTAPATTQAATQPEVRP